jgi:hypothetical protein
MWSRPADDNTAHSRSFFHLCQHGQTLDKNLPPISKERKREPITEDDAYRVRTEI